MKPAVLFDFDFTLADSSTAIVDCIRFAMARLDLGTPDHEAVRRTIGLPLATTLSVLTGHQDPTIVASFCSLFVERADEIMVSSTTMYSQSAHVLNALRERGIGTAIVSTKYRYRIQAILDRYNLGDAVDVIVGGEDVTRHKPHAEPLLRAIEALATDAATSIYVGDHPVDGVAARNAGVRFVRVMTGAGHVESDWDEIQPYATLEDISGLLTLGDISA